MKHIKNQKHAKKNQHMLLQLVDTPLKRVSASAVATVVSVGSVVTVMAATPKATILDNDVSYRVNLSTTDTEDLLKSANLVVGENDIVERDDTDGVVIQIRRAVCANILADGAEFTVDAHYGEKIADVLLQAGITLDDNDMVDANLSDTLKTQMCLAVTRYHRITVCDNGVIKEADVPEGTVADALKAVNIALGQEDTLSVNGEEPVTDGMEISINRVSYAAQTVTEEIPFDTEVIETADLYKGETKVQTAGAAGLKTVVKECKFINGQLSESNEVAVLTETAPTNEVKLVGTKIKQQPVVNTVTQPAQTTAASGGTVVDTNGNILNVARVLTGACTAYTGGGTTASGAPAAVGRVAVNPSVIPYGTRLYIASPDGRVVYGYAIASDTGGALMGGHVIADLYYDTYAECRQFGRRQMNIYILA